MKMTLKYSEINLQQLLDDGCTQKGDTPDNPQWIIFDSATRTFTIE